MSKKTNTVMLSDLMAGVEIEVGNPIGRADELQQAAMDIACLLGASREAKQLARLRLQKIAIVQGLEDRSAWNKGGTALIEQLGAKRPADERELFINSLKKLGNPFPKAEKTEKKESNKIIVTKAIKAFVTRIVNKGTTNETLEALKQERKELNDKIKGLQGTLDGKKVESNGK